MFDKTIDNPYCFAELQNITKSIFNTKDIKKIEGKANIQYDAILNSVFNTHNNLNVEIKTRNKSYGDISVEITQYRDESLKYRKLKDGSINKTLDFLYNKSTGWAWHTTADVILYLTPTHVDVISWRLCKEYLTQNFKYLRDTYCSLTTGSYSKVIDYNEITREFIDRFDSKELKKHINNFYQEYRR